MNYSSRNLLPYPILIFLGFILPIFLSLEDPKYSVIRGIFYTICFLASCFIFVEDIIFNKQRLSLAWYLVLVLTLWISGHLIIAKVVYDLDGSGGDLIGISYCIFGLALGTKLNQISQHKYFLSLLYVIWFSQSYLVISSIDPLYLQASYGKEDPLFSGAYQYIGDVFALISMLVIFQTHKVLNDSLQAKILRKQEYLAQQQLQKYSSLKRKQYRQVHSNTFILLAVVIFSNVILFLNGSRASFFSFLLTTCFIGYTLIFYVRSQTSWLLFFVPVLALLIAGLTSIYNPQFTMEGNWDILLSNRNLELVSNNDSVSLEGRNSFYNLGLQDLIKNPTFGNYIGRVADRGTGTYIHNILSLAQDFGFPALAIFSWLIAYCSIFFSHQWIAKYDYEKHVFDSLLIFSAIQLIFFRNFTGFYTIYIIFGIIAYRSDKNKILS